MASAVDLVQNKPVATTGTIGVLAAGIEAYAESRGWIPATLAPYVIAATVALLAAAAHALVSPAKKVKDVLERGLQVTDADFGRCEAVLEGLGLQIVQKQLEPKPAHAATEPPAPPADAPADAGMSAGAPAAPPAAPLVTGTAAPVQTTA